jgi:hypothetical protein
VSLPPKLARLRVVIKHFTQIVCGQRHIKSPLGLEGVPARREAHQSYA